MADKPIGFVALTSLKQGPPDPAAAIAEIRRIYFSTTKKTVDNDLTHAIELLRAIPDEEMRDRAAVFMDGLQQMKNDWAKERGNSPGKPKAKPKGRKPGAGDA